LLLTRRKDLRIKDAQVKKNLRWHILRLLRLNSRTREELVGKIEEMYIGFWEASPGFWRDISGPCPIGRPS
jgi:hypothetical protein